MTPSSTPRLFTTGYGRPALATLARIVLQAKGDEPLAPVTVIVPNNFVAVSTRRGLAIGDHGPVCSAGTGVAGVTFLTVYRLAELLGAGRLAAQGRRPLSTPVLAAAVRTVLQTSPGVFHRVHDHPTTERRLVAAHRELSEVDEPALDRLAQQSARAADVVRIHRRIRELLAAQWHGEQELLAAATAELAEGTNQAASVLADLGSVVVFLPDDLTRTRGDLLKVVAAHAPVAVVAGLTGHADADTAVGRSLGFLGLETPPAERFPLPSTHTISVSDPDDEVRHAIRGVLDAARTGVPFDRMAIVFGSDDPYARLLHDHLTAADIPFNGAAVSGLAESMAGRTLLRILQLGDRDFRREDVMALLASSPLSWHGQSPPTGRWDQLSREAGIVRGAADWDTKLERLATDIQNQLDRLGQDPEYEGRTNRLTRQLEWVRSLQAFIAQLVVEMQRSNRARSWAERSRWAKSLLDRYLTGHERWPDHEQLALERLNRVLDRLGTLDAIEPEPSATVFRRTLDLELEGGLGRVGRFGNGVLLGQAWMVAGLSLDRVWVLGLAEGTFPSRSRDDSLLPDRERAVTAGQLRPRAERTGDEHRHFLAALAAVGPDGHAELIRPRGDLRSSSERSPSRWLVDLAQDHMGTSMRGAELDDLANGWSTLVPSFTGGLLHTPFPATPQEFDLRDLVATVTEAPLPLDHRLLRDTPGLARSLEMQRSRHSAHFTRFDGNLAGVGVASPVEDPRPASATGLESWAYCPHQYFVRRILGVYPLDTPEQRLRIDALSRGSLVHEILETFVNLRIAAQAHTPPPAADGTAEAVAPWSVEERDQLLSLAADIFERTRAEGLTGEPVYWRRDQVLIRRDLEAFLKHDSDRRVARSLRPLHTELAFGGTDQPSVAIPLPDGRTFALRGSIDLVDIDTQGALSVIDYKTGSKSTVSEDDPHQNGTRLQLVLYAHAARQILSMADSPVYSAYWYVSTKGQFKRAGYDVTPVIEREVGGALSQIVDGIAAGMFPQHPELTTRPWVACEYCDPDGLGTREARRRFERLVEARELDRYAALAEPNLLPPAALTDAAS